MNILVDFFVMAESKIHATSDGVTGNIAAQLQWFKQLVSESNIEDSKNTFNEELEAWKAKKLNVAVVGSSGQGKSSIINTIRGLKPKDTGAARVGITETTLTITPYSDPNNPNLIYWDLPGCGTSEFPCNTYLQKIEFEKYDFFLIITATRFTENDLWLAQETEKRNKRFYLIRTKIDVDISNEMDDDPDQTEDRILNHLREDCLDHLKSIEKAKYSIFLLSGRCQYYYKWDFPHLINSLLQDCEGIKKDAIILSFSANCKEVMDQKYELLKSRIKKISALSAMGRAVPIPGFSLAVDTALIMEEITEYRKQFGLDSESLKKLNGIQGINEEEIKNKLSEKGIATEVLFASVASYVIRILTMFAGAVLAEEALGLIPVVGWLTASAISYATTYKALEYALNAARDAALAILDVLQQIKIMNNVNDIHE